MGFFRSLFLLLAVIILGPLAYIFQLRIAKLIKMVIIIAICGSLNFIPVLGQIASAVLVFIFYIKIYKDMKYYRRY